MLLKIILNKYLMVLSRMTVFVLEKYKLNDINCKRFPNGLKIVS